MAPEPQWPDADSDDPQSHDSRDDGCRSSPVLDAQRALCLQCQENHRRLAEQVLGDRGLMSRVAVLEASSREIKRIRDKAFVTVKDALVAAISAGVTAAAMYVFRLL